MYTEEMVERMIVEFKQKKEQELENYQKQLEADYQNKVSTCFTLQPNICKIEKEKKLLEEHEKAKKELRKKAQSMDESYSKTLSDLDTTIQSLNEKLDSGNFDKVMTPPKLVKEVSFMESEMPKSSKPTVPFTFQPVLSLDFADDLFKENDANKDNFDFFDEDY